MSFNSNSSKGFNRFNDDKIHSTSSNKNKKHQKSSKGSNHNEKHMDSLNNYWIYSNYSKIDSIVKEKFPFKNARPHQLETISEIKEAIDKGYKYIVLEAGTGTGKSVIAATLARIYEYAYILTMTKQLQEQYYDDFKYLGFRLVKGRGNFECRKYADEAILETCDFGRCKLETYRCEYKVHQDNYDKRPKQESCNYFYQKMKAVRNPVVISNYHYAFDELNYLNDFSKRRLLICDEAHNLESLIMNLLTLEFTRVQLKDEVKINLSKTRIDKLNQGEYSDWISFINRIKEKYKENIKEINNIPDNKKTLKTIRKYKTLKNRVDDFNRFIRYIKKDPKNWIVDYDAFSQTLSFKPIKIDKYAYESLLKYGDICVFMSGTILNYKLFAKYLGIKEEEIYPIRRKSPFDVRRNPIKTYRNLNMSYSNLPQVSSRSIPLINEILENHKDDKGLIHTVSYNCKEFLKKELNNKRLIDHKTSNRFKKLNKFIKSKKPLVLISPSMDEGVDLPGDLCRFQIIYKIPYPSLGDSQTKARKKIDPLWYRYQTVIRLVQTYGRGLRFQNDYCRTYFMDSRLKGFIKRDERKDHLIPDYFRQAIDLEPLDKSELDKQFNDVKKEFKDNISEIRNDNDFDEIETISGIKTVSLYDESFLENNNLKDNDLNDNLDGQEGLELNSDGEDGLELNSDGEDGLEFNQLDNLEGKDGLELNSKEKSPNNKIPTGDNDSNDKIDSDYFKSLAKQITEEEGYKNQRALTTIRKSDYVDFANSEALNEKYSLMEKGRNLEKAKEWEKAISFYEDLKDNPLFMNDYYPYRRLCIIHKKRKNHKEDLDTIIDFFNREIYCNNYQFVWFRNKITELATVLDLDDNTVKNIDDLIEDFENNREFYHIAENLPVPIAERIYDKKGIILISDEKYQANQRIFAIKEYGAGLERQKRYEKAIDYYLFLLDNELLFFKELAYNRLALIYKRIDDKSLLTKHFE